MLPQSDHSKSDFCNFFAGKTTISKEIDDATAEAFLYSIFFCTIGSFSFSFLFFSFSFFSFLFFRNKQMKKFIEYRNHVLLDPVATHAPLMWVGGIKRNEME